MIDDNRPVRLRNLLTKDLEGVDLRGHNYRWHQHDALLLADSVMRGYPIGAPIFAYVHGSTGVKRILVDGYQRLMTLGGLLCPWLFSHAPRFEVFFDLKEARFVSAPGEHTFRPEIMYDPYELASFLETYQGPRGERNRAQWVAEVFREYLVPVTAVALDSLDDVARLRARIQPRSELLQLSVSGSEEPQ